MKLKFILAGLALMPALSFAQQTVNTSGSKYALIEESTGKWCGYCPDGAIIVEGILASKPKAIAVAIHDNNDATVGNVNSNDAMEIAAGRIYDTTNGYCNGFPNGSVDRIPGTNGKCGQSRSLWSSMTTTALANTPKFDITMSHAYSQSTSTLTVWVYAKSLAAITGDYNTNVYVTEDSIQSTGSGYAQHSYFYFTTGHALEHVGILASDSSYATLGATEYYHNNVLRAALGGTWGTTGVITTNSASGVTYMKKYTYTMPANFKKKNLHLIGMVQKNNPADKNDRAIANSILAKFDSTATAVNIENVATSFDDLEIYPNPATNVVNITATLQAPLDTKVTICNTIGQVVDTRTITAAGNYISESISTDKLSNGVYMITLSNEGSTVTRKFVVNK